MIDFILVNGELKGQFGASCLLVPDPELGHPGQFLFLLFQHLDYLPPLVGGTNMTVLVGTLSSNFPAFWNVIPGFPAMPILSSFPYLSLYQLFLFRIFSFHLTSEAVLEFLLVLHDPRHHHLLDVVELLPLLAIFWLNLFRLATPSEVSCWYGGVS